MDKSDQVTGLTFERAPYSEACHTLFQTKRDHKILGSPPVTETFPVYQTLSELSGAPQTKTHASLRDACQVRIYLLVSGASFIFENALQLLAPPCSEALSSFQSAPNTMEKHSHSSTPRPDCGATGTLQGPRLSQSLRHPQDLGMPFKTLR